MYKKNNDLARLIEEGSAAWEGVDPDEYLNEVRGREPENLNP